MSEDTQLTNPKRKKWMKIIGLSFAIMVILAAMGYGGYYLLAKRQITPAPEFSIITLSANNFTLSNYKGQVVLLDFMSVTCEPCKQLMPDLIAISKQFNSSLKMLSIDVDLTDTEAQLLAFKQSFNATWEFAFDNDNLQAKYAVIQLPKTIIIDKEGYVTFTESGLTAGSNLPEIIQKTIEGKASRITARFGFSLFTAFAAGILSFFSPCAFPLLPGYMAYNLDLLVKSESNRNMDKIVATKEPIKGQIKRRVWRSFLWGSAAALGVALFYMIIGIIAAYFGEVVGNWVEYITPAIGALLIILGIISLTPISLDMSSAINFMNKLGKKRKNKDKHLENNSNKNTEVANKKRHRFTSEAPQLFQLFVYGITYALASIGCNLPILLGLILSTIESGGFIKGILIFLVYSLAMALLMIVITMLVGFSKDALINKLQASTKIVKILTGILLILAGGFLIGYFLWNRYHAL